VEKQVGKIAGTEDTREHRLAIDFAHAEGPGRTAWAKADLAGAASLGASRLPLAILRELH